MDPHPNVDRHGVQEMQKLGQILLQTGLKVWRNLGLLVLLPVLHQASDKALTAQNVITEKLLGELVLGVG